MDGTVSGPLPDFVKSGAGSPHLRSLWGCHTRILCMYQVYALPHCIAYASFMIPRGFKINGFLCGGNGFFWDGANV